MYKLFSITYFFLVVSILIVMILLVILFGAYGNIWEDI
jgi:hypothetical protein